MTHLFSVQAYESAESVLQQAGVAAKSRLGNQLMQLITKVKTPNRNKTHNRL